MEDEGPQTKFRLRKSRQSLDLGTNMGGRPVFEKQISAIFMPVARDEPLCFWQTMRAHRLPGRPVAVADLWQFRQSQRT